MASGLTEIADLILEDGTGIEDANSYNDIATVDAYANLRQDAPALAWIGADESNKVAALIIATQYLDLRWSYRGFITYPGSDALVTQKLQWPRDNVADSRGVPIAEDVIPIIISEACSEYAARAIDPATNEARALLNDLVTQDASGRSIIETLAVVGPLKEQFKYKSSGGRNRYTDYGTADRIIRDSGFLSGSGESAVTQ